MRAALSVPEQPERSALRFGLFFCYMWSPVTWLAIAIVDVMDDREEDERTTGYLKKWYPIEDELERGTARVNDVDFAGYDIGAGWW